MKYLYFITYSNVLVLLLLHYPRACRLEESQKTDLKLTRKYFDYGHNYNLDSVQISSNVPVS